MKQVFKTKSKEILIEEVPAPIVQNGNLLIKVMSSLISSGTETMGMSSSTSGVSQISALTGNIKKVIDYIEDNSFADFYRKYKSRDNISSGSGYSVAGIVVKKGKDIVDFQIGDKVAAAGSGIAQHAEYVLVPKNLIVKMEDDISFDEAAFTTVGSIALQGVRQANVQIGETVLVVGLGLIGLITVQILKSAGCRVFGTDLYKSRTQLGLGFGMDYALNKDSEFIEDVLKKTGGVGVDTVIITAASSSKKIVNEAMKMVRKKGRVVVVGAVNMDIDRSPFYEKEVEFTISCSYGPGRYDHDYELRGQDYPIEYVRWTENRNMQSFMWLIAQKKIDVKTLISHTFEIDDAPSAFKTILENPAESLAVILHYKNNDESTPANYLQTSTDKKTTSNEFINFGVIGIGSFAKRIYLPEIYKNKKLKLKAVASKTGFSSKKVANEFGAEFCTTDYNNVLEDSSIDAVIISTRHNLHYPIIVDALKRNKHVLVEKPICLTREELENLKEQLKESQTIFTVGHNRRYSQFSMRAKEIIEKENSPCIINYRVNAGYIPPNSWVHNSEQGGGRIIGEGTHFYDLLCYFINSKVQSLNVDFIPIDSKGILNLDNYISTIKYENGSIATLTYTSIGNKELPKEYIEIFINNKSIIIDDFRSLKVMGISNKDIKLKIQDKGYSTQLREFIKALEGKPSKLLTVNEAITATELALQTHDMVNI